MNEIAVSKQADVTIYDPEKGLKIIATAEAGEKHWARAKDASQLMKAIETKIVAQAEYAIWRGTVLPPSRNMGKQRNYGVSDMKPQKLPAADPGHLVVHRWRKQSCKKTSDGWEKDQAKIDLALEHAAIQCIQICEQLLDAGRHGHLLGKYEWYTPQEIVEAARTVMGGIDLDPASCSFANRMVKAQRFYSEADNGLEKEWKGKVFLNPPFAHPIVRHFADKLITSHKTGTVEQAVWLSNACVDVGWWQELASIGVICFHLGRIKFYGQDDVLQPPTLGQSIIYLGNRAPRFRQIFKPFGVVVAP
jgi:hypothetical protein